MLTNSGFLPTRPDSLSPEKARPTTLTQLLRATQDLKLEPIITLAMALEQLGLLHPREIEMLTDEDPQLLRSRSPELVERLLLTPEDLHHALARTAGIVEVDAANFMLPERAFDGQLLRKMRNHDLLFLGEADETLFIASWHPTDEDMYHHLCTLTGRSVRVVWADRDAIVARLERMDPLAPKWTPEHDMLTAHQAVKRKALTTPLAATNAVTVHDQDMEHLMDEAVQGLSSVQPRKAPQELDESSDSPIMVRMVKRLIMDAQALHASDIHIETNPGEEFSRIRLRRDGDLELYQKLSPRLRAAMVSRIKIMARLDISEHRRPQDGKINFSEFGGDSLELRVSIMPTHDGMEDVVMRLLASSKPVPLAKLGLQPRDAEAVARTSARSFGLILAAGPTGSGKTTTLHSMLAEINTEERKIWTAEDPIEITQPGLRQVQVNPKIGLTFANAMRGFLRADPDVIMIGEIRDQETAKIVIEASLTGHLVLSTLHTNSASESVVRLLDLGMDALNFADSLVGIVAQRLVRSLCPHCSQKGPLLPGQFTELVKEYVQASPLSEEEGARRLLAAAGVQTPEEVTLKTAQGCDHCGGKGYKGRMGIYEILENSPTLRLLIQRNARPAEIYEEAIKSGMRSLRHDALEKCFQGLIDLHQARLAYL
ncbi:GspE/PulE family protein [Polaromonas hydrogenivorans]|uniref:GspE/PulE family protein n=1 Tax=Polaromonas hydrogenivorans TaxID=335476 RepID=A0AAU7LUD0_9BURK